VGAARRGGAGAAAFPAAAKIPVAGAGATGADGPSSSDVSTTGSEPGALGADSGTGFTARPEP
jgi:hypothetical protein